MSTVKLKRNDKGREFEDVFGIALGGASVVFVMKNIVDGTVFRIDGEITDVTIGKVKVTLSEEHTQVVATYNAEWEITFNDGDVLALPEDSYHTVEVVPDLGEESA